MSLDKIEKISKVGEKLKELQVDRTGQLDTAVMKERFEALMRDDVKKPHETDQLAKDAHKASPMEEAGKIGGQTNPTSRATADDIVQQSNSTVERIEGVKQTIASSELTLKPSVEGLLSKKLHHIDSNIKVALQKAGAKEADLKAAGNDEQLVDGVMNPVHRFLGLLTDGQNKLENLSTIVGSVGPGEQLSPSSMLAIQIKVARVQHEIELFTSLLNKALEGTKTIMNVQV